MQKKFYFLSLVVMSLPLFSFQVKTHNSDLTVHGSNEVVYFGETLRVGSGDTFSSDANSVVIFADTVKNSGTINTNGNIEFEGENNNSELQLLTSGGTTNFSGNIKVDDVYNIKLFVDEPIGVASNRTIESLAGIITTTDNWQMGTNSSQLEKDPVLTLKTGASFGEIIEGYAGAVDGSVTIEEVPNLDDEYVIPFKRRSSTGGYERRFFSISKAPADPPMSAKITFFARNPLSESFTNPNASLDFDVADEFWRVEITGSGRGNNNILVGITGYLSEDVGAATVVNSAYYNVDSGGSVGEWVGPVEVSQTSGYDNTQFIKLALQDFEEGYISPANRGSNRVRKAPGEAYNFMTLNGDGENDGLAIEMEDGVTYSVSITRGDSGIKVEDPKLDTDDYENFSWVGTCRNSSYICSAGQVISGVYFVRVVSSTGKTTITYLHVTRFDGN